MMAQFYKWDDGWFTYYINPDTGETKRHLDSDDEEVDIKLDDFIREHEGNIL